MARRIREISCRNLPPAPRDFDYYIVFRVASFVSSTFQYAAAYCFDYRGRRDSTAHGCLMREALFVLSLALPIFWYYISHYSYAELLFDYIRSFHDITYALPREEIVISPHSPYVFQIPRVSQRANTGSDKLLSFPPHKEYIFIPMHENADVTLSLISRHYSSPIDAAHRLPI